MANPYRDDQLAQALKMSRGATRKISRLKSKVDVYVAGTEYDPRKSPKQLRRYTTAQLEAYNRRVAQFNDRGTQFVPDAKHRPIPAAEFKDYKTAELARRKHVLDQYNKVKDIPLPGGHETIGQRRDKMRSDRKMAGNPSVNDPYSPPVRSSKNIADRAALKALTRDEKKKSKKGWDDKELKRQIGEFDRMLATIGDADLAAKVSKLTAGQFRSLWNDTNFATAVSQEYFIYKQGLVDENDKPWYQQLIHDSFQDAHRLADWAKNLDL